MIYQLIIREVQWIQYLINIGITIVGRLLDLLSTRYVSKELKLETNRLAQRIGWKGMILMQIPLVIFGALDFYFSLFIFWWSIFLFANNIEGSWYVKEAGEETYYKELESRVKKSTMKKILFSEISHLLKYTLAGTFIIIFLFVYNDFLAVFLISLALILHGVFGTISSILYLSKLKKSANQEAN
ncbi:MAG: hypothetical protein KGD65_09005 [Candidatus Lokiarchaeota archaeon]|nr:hypothetical protein [Candidatus Lokiarchaeota archaeon]